MLRKAVARKRGAGEVVTGRDPSDIPFTRKAFAGSTVGAWENDGTTPCWVWNGCVQSSGYPSVCAGKKGVSVLLHRAVLAEKVGRPLRGFALHSCDVKRCVNPEHLREGTHTENMRDAIDRGRIANGAKNGRATITPLVAWQIKRALSDGAKVADVARLYGVARHIAEGIRRGIRGKRGGTWAHL